MMHHNGIEYARVSDILATYFPYSKYVQDSGKLGPKAQIGTNVHQAINDHMTGKMFYVTKEEAPFFQSFLKWKEYIKPDHLHPEMRIYDKDLRLTGQIDLLVFYPGTKLPILTDFKCIHGKQDKWEYQAHFYQMLLKRAKYRVAERMVFLRLSHEGKLPKAFNFNYNPKIEVKCCEMLSEYWQKKSLPKR